MPGLLGIKSILVIGPIFGDFTYPEAQNWTNKPAHALNYKQNWTEPSLACRPRLTEVRETLYL